MQKKFDSLASIHDAEVTQLFESKSTLAFVQKMRSFKQAWTEKAADDDNEHSADFIASQKWACSGNGFSQGVSWGKKKPSGMYVCVRLQL